MKLTFSKKFIALYSLTISLVLTLPATILRVTSGKQGVGSSLINWITFGVYSAIFVFLIWIYIRWVASTAEKAGRSYVGFMIVAAMFPLIAWLIVLLFKKPEVSPPST